MKILCRTLFDCSHTGVTGHYRASQVPFQDRTGQTIENLDQWNRARNQQRNWETLLQIIGLRCQPMDIVYPVQQDDHWQFLFATDMPGIFDPDFAALYQDCAGVPMLVGLGEHTATDPVLTVTGPTQNIWFEALNS
jgi:hypothetical protein